MELDEFGRPGMPFAGGEVETLLGFLDFQRATLAWKCRGLSDEQLRISLPPTDMSLGGMLMHLARVEDSWFSDVVAEAGPADPWRSMEWSAEWRDAGRETGEELRRIWTASTDRSRAVVAAALADGDAGLTATHSAWD